MTTSTFDVNCDMGEGFGNWRIADDAAIMKLISTANIACGFHAGDPAIMRATVQMAKAAGVAVGAHPGLPDMLGFGRRHMAVTPNDVFSYIVYQVGALKGFLDAEGMRLNHVKPHGAMLSVLHDPILAEAAIDAIIAIAPQASLYWTGPVGRQLFAARAAERGLRVCWEAYPDLNYSGEGDLIVEREKKPVSPNLIEARVREVIEKQTLTTSTGAVLKMNVESICIHSDTPNAVDNLLATKRAMEQLGRTLGCATA